MCSRKITYCIVGTVVALLILITISTIKQNNILPLPQQKVDLSPVGLINVAQPEPPVHYNETILPKVYNNYTRELNCLTENIYFEARGQHIIGQLAVGLVTLNRVISSRYPDTICDVVWQKKKNPKTKKMVAQFSWTLDEYSNIPKKDTDTYRNIERLAGFLLDRESAITDFTNGATHYHSVNVNPGWAKKITYIAQYENHLFYREKK